MGHIEAGALNQVSPIPGITMVAFSLYWLSPGPDEGGAYPIIMN